MSGEFNDGIVIALLHDEGDVGMQWRQFMEDMLTVNLPENLRDLGIDVQSISVRELDEDIVDNINQCPWKLFLLSHAMLKEMEDSSSFLMNSNLLTTNPDRVILLVLGGIEDTGFQEDVKKCLFFFRDFSQFHLVYATSTGKIFNDFIKIVSPLYIVFHPNILSTEDLEQHLTLIANKPYPSLDGASFVAEFDLGDKKVEAEARLFNPCTLLLQNPGGLSTGVFEVKLLMILPKNEDDNPQSYQLGNTMKVKIQSDLDKLNSILEKSNNPFQFLCQAFGVDPNNQSARDVIDKRLTDSFRKHVPENQLTRVFGTDLEVGPDASEERSKEFAPTLLHFAAMHGLRNLTAQLLRCPGAVRAYGTANCDGDYPTTLAEKGGHWDLKNYMTSYMEVSAMVDYEVGATRNTSEMMAQMVTGQYLSVPESIYDVNNKEEETPLYLSMKPLIQAYDSPFIVPIPSSDSNPNYEKILVQMIESEDTYMTLENRFPFYSPTGPDPPPPPPRDVSPPPENIPVSLHRMAPDEPPFPPPSLPEETSYPTRAVMDEPVYRSHAVSEQPPLPPSHPSTRTNDASSIRREGADRVSYGSLNMPKVASYVSPAQRELIILQQKVKSNQLTTNQAVVRFKEWERKHKEQAASFQFQQECLERIRSSLMKSKEEKRQRGEDDTILITKPIIAGSSTYDLVLKKTNVVNPVEVTPVYGVAKPPKLEDGFSRSSSVSSADPQRSISIASSCSSNASGNSNLYTSRRTNGDNTYGTRPPPRIPPREPVPSPSAPSVPPRKFY